MNLVPHSLHMQWTGEMAGGDEHAEQGKME